MIQMPQQIAFLSEWVNVSSHLRWWVVGGWALSAYFGESWRTLDDIDVAVLESQRVNLQEALTGWTIAFSDGSNRGSAQSTRDRWRVDLTTSTGDSSCWIYRHDHHIRVSWESALTRTGSGVHILAPELVLLTKARSPRIKDNLDAVETIPRLGSRKRRFLSRALDVKHPWQALLNEPHPRQA